MQGYDGQAADVTQHVNHNQEMHPIIGQVEENLGEIPDRVFADAGYHREAIWQNSTL